MFEINIQKPICFMCNKEVEEMEKGTCFLTNRTIFIAKCHGEREVTAINEEIIYNMISIEPGIAFYKRLIPDNQFKQLEKDKEKE